MSNSQAEQLANLESVIEINQIDFYALGQALKAIRDERLYRQQYFNSFDLYVKERWDMNRAQAYRLIAASQVIDNLSPLGDKLPENEAQARELAKLNVDKQARVWQDFLNSDLTPGARNLRQFIANQSSSSSQSQQIHNDVTQITNEYYSAVMALLEQIKVAQNKQWQLTTKAAALHWNQVMRDRILAQEDRK